MMKTVSILLVGVGGQGTILASKILTDVALRQGYDVKMTEIHGMAQRGGSVVTQVRMGAKVHSPLIEPGQADYIVAFEQLEALRWLHFLNDEGTMIVNTQRINPMTVITGAAEYPGDALEQIKANAPHMVQLNALEIAKQLGNMRVVNVVLLGAMAKQMDIPKEDWMAALEATVPSRFLELNRQAFQAGYEA
ncbi:MAG TPA: indolepyruvate oxidoreductase subunit beta [Firmicutes bacterium]|nr:indolepyruvate oxidoreductase subunit beta [Bacillota bacterium]